MKFTINRKRWQRGKGWKQSALYLEDNRKMCCLGQVARQCGIPVKAIKEEDALAQIEEASERAKLPKWLTRKSRGQVFNTHACGNAMNINDSEELSDAEREAKLTALFAKHGDELEFIN